MTLEELKVLLVLHGIGHAYCMLDDYAIEFAEMCITLGVDASQRILEIWDDDREYLVVAMIDGEATIADGIGSDCPEYYQTKFEVLSALPVKRGEWR